MTALPLPGYQVSMVAETEIENYERSFKVHHATQQKIYYFQADDKSVRNRFESILFASNFVLYNTDIFPG